MSLPHRTPVRALLFANAVSLTGNALSMVAIPWFVLETTGSAARTGLVFAAVGVAEVLAAFFGGPVVDRLGFKRVSVVSDLASLVAVALVPVLYAMGLLGYWGLVSLAFAGALLDPPSAAARGSMIPDLADRAAMPRERANSLTFGVERLSLMLGPPLAGALVASVGAINVLWLNAASFVVSAATISLFVPPTHPRGTEREGVRTQSGPRGYAADLAEGLGFLRRDGLIFAIVVAGVGYNFLYSPLGAVVLTVYAKQVYGSALDLGLMVGCFGAGSVLAAVLFAAFGHRLPRRAAFSLSALTMGLPLTVLVFEPPVAVSAVALAAGGLAGGAVNPIVGTLIQERTPRELLGRVLSTFTALALTAVPLGAALFGWALEVLEARHVVLLVGLGTLTNSLVLVLNPAVRGMPERSGRED